MGIGLNHYSLAVKSGRSLDGFSDDGLVNSNVLVFVYTAGTKTLATIYSDNIATAKTNPISRSQFATDGKVDFWIADSSVDIFINDEKGNVGQFLGATPQSHTIRIDVGNPDKHLIVPFAATAVEVDSGLVIPNLVKVTDCIVEVVVAQAAKTLNVGLLSSGTGGVAAGFVSAASLATAGVVANNTTTLGSNETFIATSLYGSLMGLGKAGADTAQHYGLPGNTGYIASGSNTRNITYTGSSGTSSATGYIHLFFQHLR